MKKLLCVLLSVVMLFTMVACGGKSQTAILTYEQNGVTMKYTLESKGDIIHTITQTSTIDGSVYTEEQLAVIEDSISQYQALYEQIKGVTYSTDVEGSVFVETIEIDASNETTITTLSSQGLLPIDGSSANISLEKTVKNLVSQGWVLQE